MKKKKIIPKISFKPLIRVLPAIVLLFILIIIGLGTNNKPNTFPSPEASPLYQDFHLVIPSLALEAPIIANVDGADQKAYDKALEDGVAQLKGSAKPGEGSNIFIFGHSSYYFWSPGNYKEIFRHLDDLKIDDEIFVWYQGKKYRYRVSSKKTVNPSQVDVTLPTKEEQVSLMTCVPPGTTLKRLVIVAQRMY